MTRHSTRNHASDRALSQDGNVDEIPSCVQHVVNFATRGYLSKESSHVVIQRIWVCQVAHSSVNVDGRFRVRELRRVKRTHGGI